MEMKTKIETVAVVFGGRSGEHEVSIITAHQVMDALEVAGYSLLPIYISKDGEWFAGQKLNNLKLFTGKDLNLNKLDEVWKVSLSPDRSIRTLLLHPEGKRGLFRKPPQLWADVFFPTIHGSFGEDGTLQGLFELADVPYVGSNVLASAVGMDKSKMKDFSRAAGIPILECITLSRNEFQRDPQTNLGRLESFCKYPLMVKPLRLGSSIGVKRCNNSEELKEAIEVAFLLDSDILAERALGTFTEVNCSVIGPPEQASVCEQALTSGDILSFESKYKEGDKKTSPSGQKGGMASAKRIVPAPLSPSQSKRIQDLAVKAFRAIGASGVARLDFLIDQSNEALFLNEINTMPGSLAFYLWEASGLPFDRLVKKVIDIGLESYAAKSGTKFSFEANLLVSSK
jgi:D-alanine-D-alanine ligase